MPTIKTFGPVDDRSLKQLRTCMEAGDAEYGVLCADHHPGYSQPIGGAIAYEGFISPSGCGFDIACGNKAVLTDVAAPEVDVEGAMKEISRRISFGVGVPARERVDHPVLDRIRRAPFAPQRKLYDLAAKQLGTVGGGNHFVNLFEDEEGRLWVGVHFGSRGFGHKTAMGFLALAEGLPFDESERKRRGLRVAEGGMDSPPVLLSVDSEVGQTYIEAMQLAGDYAYAGRDVVVDKVLGILGARPVHEVHNHHNFCISGDACIPTPDGPRRMDSLQAGDRVYSFHPERGIEVSRVLRQWHSRRKPIYAIETGNRTLRCSADHPVLVVEIGQAHHVDRPGDRKRAGRLEWKPASAIRPGDVVVCADRYYTAGDEVGPSMARFMGAFLGDGWTRSKNTRISGYSVGLAIGGSDEPHTARYAELCRSLFPEARWRNNAPGAYGLTCSSRAVWTQLHELGLAAPSSEKSLPAVAYRLSEDEKRELLGGYFDSDGSVADGRTSNHGRGTIATVSEPLVFGLRELAMGSGMRVSRIRAENRATNYGRCRVYRCVVGADSMAELDLWHEGKAERLRHTKLRRGQGLSPRTLGYLALPPGAIAQRVRSVSVAESVDVYDIAVEHESHSFVCDGVVVHNCWRERVDGRDVWVVRKGCTPANPGQEGFVGATMGDESVILEGVEDPESDQALYSTVHGAGRVMSRSQAAGRVKRQTVYQCSERDCDYSVPARRYKGERCPEHPDRKMRKVRVERQVRPGQVDWPKVQERIRRQGIVLVGGGADEAPEVYKRLPEVLAAHGHTIRVKHRLKPLGVAMAGADVFDPFKD